MRTGIVSHELFSTYRSSVQTIESPERISSTMGIIRDNSRLKFIESEYPERDDVLDVHPDVYLKYLEGLSVKGIYNLDNETPVTDGMLDVAFLAAGGAIQSVKGVMENDVDNTFALVRPPGHHAGRIKGEGFCYLNNLAVAGKFLRNHYNVDNLLILDWDNHYGNGTVDIFKGDKRTLCVLVNEDPFNRDKSGFVDVDDNLIHVALPEGVGKSYTVIWKKILETIPDVFSPDFVLCSAGQDSHFADPLSNQNVIASQYKDISDGVVDLANRECGGKIAMFLEGGYNIPALSICNYNIVQGLSGLSETLVEEEPMYWWFKYGFEPREVTRRIYDLIMDLNDEVSKYLFK